MYKPNLLIRNLWILFGWLALVPLLVIACRLGSNAEISAPGLESTPVFVPPTAILAVPDPTLPGEGLQEAGVDPSSLQQAAATPLPECIDNLYWLEDLTIPDGSTVPPGTELDKRWKVQNNGTCNWDKDYRIRLIGGPGLGAPEEQALYPARSGAEALIRIVFTAPQEPGAYRSAWQAYTPDGTPFGDPFYIDIVVEGSPD